MEELVFSRSTTHLIPAPLTKFETNTVFKSHKRFLISFSYPKRELISSSFTVALSRAKEGLFILGNASNLASKSDMWHSVIRELKENGAVATAFPISCHRHPESVRSVSEPCELPQIAPDGEWFCLLSVPHGLKCT